MQFSRRSQAANYTPSGQASRVIRPVDVLRGCDGAAFRPGAERPPPPAPSWARQCTDSRGSAEEAPGFDHTVVRNLGHHSWCQVCARRGSTLDHIKKDPHCPLEGHLPHRSRYWFGFSRSPFQMLLNRPQQGLADDTQEKRCSHGPQHPFLFRPRCRKSLQTQSACFRHEHLHDHHRTGNDD